MRYVLLDLLLKDHRRIEVLCAELKSEAARSSRVDEEHCFHIFRTLKALLTAHSKAEEYTLYALFDVGRKCRSVELQHFALEGYEEHDLIDKILKEMGQAEEVNPQWCAQLKVLNDLINRHFMTEEQVFLPAACLILSEEELGRLGPDYLIERDQIFAKKSGMSIESANLPEMQASPISRSHQNLLPHQTVLL